MVRAQEVLILESMMPPDGYTLEVLLGSTYSLSPAVLLSVAAVTTSGDRELGKASFDDLTKEEKRSIVLDGLRKILLFCDRQGALQGSKKTLSEMEILAMDTVVKERGRDSHGQGSLHSKFLLGIYKENSGQKRVGRFYLGSQNLTLATFGEFGAVYELLPQKQASEFNESLVDFLNYLRQAEVPRDHEKLKPLTRGLSLVKKYRLAPKDREVRLLWQGRIATKGQKIRSLLALLEPFLKQGWTQSYIHSPWVRAPIVNEFLKLLGPSHRMQIRCLKEPKLTYSSQVLYDLFHSVDGKLRANYSHQKVYLFTKAKDALLVFGSANFTGHGMGLVGGPHQPNVETLILCPVQAKNFAYLKEMQCKEPDLDEPLMEREEDARDRDQRFLDSVSVSFCWDAKGEKLCYEIQAQGLEDEAPSEFEVAHLLLEPSPLTGVAEIPVFRGQMPMNIEVSFPRTRMNELSSIIAIRCRESGAESHQTVDLDAEIYEERRNLSFLQYKKSEFLSSLAALMEFPLSNDNDHEEEEVPRNETRLQKFLEGMKLEKYALRMRRLKAEDRTLFDLRLKRIRNLIAEPFRNHELADNPDLIRLCRILEGIHEAIERT